MSTVPHPNEDLPLVELIPPHNRLDILERTVGSVLEYAHPVNRLTRVVVSKTAEKFGVGEPLAKKAGRFNSEYYYFSKPNKGDALNSFIETLDDSLILFFDDDIQHF